MWHNLGHKVLAAVAACIGTLLLLIFLLRWIAVPTSAFMLAHLLTGKRPAYEWVPLARMSPALPIAAVASEDQRFPDHWGFDFKSIADALQDRQRGEGLRGASTISQQVAKNLFLWSGRSWMRKGCEAALTVVIEVCWPKKRILEVYLNVAQFGPDLFGVAAASRRYFGIAPSRVTPRQAALLMAVLPNPDRYSLSPPTPYIRQRAAEIQKQVHLLGGPAYLAFDR